MKRRDFFASLTAMPLVSCPDTVPWRERLLTSGPEEYVRLGCWSIHWTGWKGALENSWLVGQWIAAPVDAGGRLDRSRWCVYASIPGQCGTYAPGDVFNLSLPEYQDAALLAPDKKLLEAYREWELEFFLKVVIEEDLRREPRDRRRYFMPSEELLSRRPQ